VEVHAGVLTVIAILSVALVVGVAAERLRIPYIVALLVVTLPLPPLQSDEHFAQSFLLVLLPTLIFDAAWNLNVRDLMRAWRAVAFLAIPGVLVTVAVVGGGLALTGLAPLVPALLLGAIIAPTDPIAVIATFRRLAVPTGLAVIVEGESLFNDGVAVVLYGAFALAVAQGSRIEPLALTWDVAYVALGGIAIGIVVAAVAYVVVRWSTDRDLHVIGSVLVAYGAYQAAEGVHESGIFASLCGGVAYRWFEHLRNDDAIVEHVHTFWSIAAFFANTVVFLIVGARIEIWRVAEHPLVVVVTLALVIGSRLALVYGFLPFLGVPQRAWQHVIALSGIRGGISLALALSLPHSIAFRDVIIDLVYGVVALTILTQGLMLGPVMRRLSLGPQGAAA
jgi:monovalent cation:H+ antiporter, CPA1 family